MGQGSRIFAWYWSRRKLIYIHETWTRQPCACGCLSGHPQEFRSLVTCQHDCIVSMLEIVSCCISLHSWYWDEIPCRSKEDLGQLLVHRVKGSLGGHLLPQEGADEPAEIGSQPEGFSEMRGRGLLPQRLADEPVPPAPMFCFWISWQSKP